MRTPAELVPGIIGPRTCFEAFLVDLGFGPGEWFGVFIVGLDEGIDMGSQLCDGGEGGAGERLIGQDREPNLDLIDLWVLRLSRIT